MPQCPLPVLTPLEAALSMVDIVTAACKYMKDHEECDTLINKHTAYMPEYTDVFQAIPPVHCLPNIIHHLFIFKDASMTIARWQYSCFKKYRKA